MRYLLFAATLLLPACATTSHRPPAATAQAQDDTLLTAYQLGPQVRKLVVRGNVIVQQGNGNLVADNRKAGQRQGTAATAPAAQATAANRYAGSLAWWVFALVGAASIVAWEWLSHQALPLAWLPWRASRNT